MKSNLEKLFFILLLLISFFMPLYQKVIPILIVLLILIRLLLGTWGGTRSFDRPSFIALTGFWVMHVVGLIYSTDLQQGMDEVVRKLSFVVFPVLFLFSPPPDNRQLGRIFKVFIFACILAFLIDLGWSTYNYINHQPWIEHFFGSLLSHLMHVGYYAWYLNFCLIIIAVYWLRFLGSSKKRRWSLLSLLLVISVMIIFTASKNQILAMLVTYVFIGIFLIKRSQNFLFPAIGIFLAVILFVIAIFKVPVVSERFLTAYEVVSGPDEVMNESESTSLRLVSWRSSVEIIREHPLIGVGTGDMESTMLRKYQDRGFSSALDRKLNSHSQYLQSMATLGIFGLLFLFAIFLLPLRIAILRRDLLLILFLFISIIAAATESVFQAQAGIVFFNFFLTLLLVSNNETERSLTGHKSKE